MKNPFHTISWIMGIWFMASASAGLADHRTRLPLEFSLEVLHNTPGDTHRIDCGQPEPIRTTRIQKRIYLAEVVPHPEEQWNAAGTRASCQPMTPSRAAEAAAVPQPVPYLIIDLSLLLRVQPWVLTPERIVAVDLTLSFRRFSGFDDAGRPSYEEYQENRQTSLIEGNDYLVPLFLPSGSEQQKLSTQELILKISTARAVAASKTAYGAIHLMTGNEGGRVLLDGGLVAEIAKNKTVHLAQLRQGLHFLTFQGRSGSTLERVVRVHEGRTTIANLGADRSHHFGQTPNGENPQGYEEFRRGSDGAVVVKIPAGAFLMGNHETERSPLEHEVYVSEFLIDKTGVTWGQYKMFADDTGRPLPLQKPFWGIHDDHPVVFVAWEEAKAYCEWAGGRLPTEAEREKAARGTDGRKYPWGNEEPTAELGVHRRVWGLEGTAAVATHPLGISPYGLHDMGGNVWEWCSDWYDNDYFAVSPDRDPKGPATGAAHVLRGGSWDSRPTVLSASCRNWGHRGYREGDFGFRCAMNSPRAPGHRLDR